MTFRFVPVPEYALRLGQAVLLLEAVVRGLNYWSTPPGANVTMTAAEQSFSLNAWGVMFVVLGVMGLSGMAWLLRGAFGRWRTQRRYQWPAAVAHMQHRFWPVHLAHVALIVLFIALFFSGIAGVLGRDPLYGYVSPYDYLVFAVGHWIFTLRRHTHAQ